MGRGGKKKKGGEKKEPEPSLEALSISEPKPSSSAASAETKPDDKDEEGFEESRNKKKRGGKKQDGSGPQSGQPAQTAPHSTSKAYQGKPQPPTSQSAPIPGHTTPAWGQKASNGQLQPTAMGQQVAPAPSQPSAWGQKVAQVPSQPSAWGQQAAPAPTQPSARGQQASPAPPQPSAWGQKVAPVPSQPSALGQQAAPAPTQPNAWGQQASPAPPQPSAWVGQSQVPGQGQPPGRGGGQGRGQGRGEPTARQQQPGPPLGMSQSQQFAPVQQAPPVYAIPPSQGPPQQQAQFQPGPQERPPQPQQVPRQQQPQKQQPQQTQAQQQVCNYKIPAKIPGKSSRVQTRPSRVLTNYLPMNIKPMKIYRYDVTTVPERPKKMIPMAFVAMRQKHFPKILLAFDQMKNCYSVKPLPGVPANDRFSAAVEIKDNNDKLMRFEVSLKATGVVDLGTILSYMASGTSLNPPSEAIQCIDVVLRQGTLESYVKAGRQFFRRPANPINLGDGLEMWTGLFQSAIFTSRPFINIDVAHKGFPKQQPLVKALVEDFRLDPSKPLERQRGFESFQLFIKNLRVVAKMVGENGVEQKREFICNGLKESANRQSFPYTDQATNRTQNMTVADYFSKIKHIRIQYPSLNCMWVGPRDKCIFYPMEMLDIAYGQALNKQLNERQLSTMVKEAATKPDVRKKKIEEVIHAMNYSRNEFFREFGLQIDDQFFPTDAKILRPPYIDCGVRSGKVEPRKGAWQSRELYKPEALSSWGFIAIECDARGCNYEQVARSLMQIGKQIGMSVAEPKMTHFNVRMSELQRILLTAVEKEIKFLFIIVATRAPRDCYHKVKQIAEKEVGILTQCVKEFTATRKWSDMTARNILLKVNAKLMGINMILSDSTTPACIQSGDVMVVGADVTHPSPEQSSIPSIAAVTASFDSKCSQYNIELSIQSPRLEVIADFEEMMVDHLRVYKSYRQNALPKKIFVFRDGVSEGQFQQVMNSELAAVHNAYRRMAGPSAPRPEVLFLLVQKRHHTRFFVPNSDQNVEPGTVVDTHIVHARELDFYLVSHQAIKGTARPTRYHAVANDGRIPDEEVEQLTYYLCHLYSRCMRSVSYPTPTYYAHLACLRARSLTHGETFDNQALEKQPRRLRVLDKMLRFSRMFFV